IAPPASASVTNRRELEFSNQILKTKQDGTDRRAERPLVHAQMAAGSASSARIAAARGCTTARFMNRNAFRAISLRDRISMPSRIDEAPGDPGGPRKRRPYARSSLLILQHPYSKQSRYGGKGTKRWRKSYASS